MGWNYDSIQSDEEKQSDTMWSSYSDLFMMLSLVFLLLYVVSSLRSGTDSIQRQLEYQRVAMEAQDYKEQNRVYNTLKNEYLEKQASEAEQEQYEQLMDKLSLLQDEARQEKQRLSQLAKENEAKETALNHYQRLIRNIINANMLAKSGLQRRDQIIETKRQTIKQTKALLSERESELEQRNEQLAQKQEIIEQAERSLQEKSEIIENLNQEIDEKRKQIEQNNDAIKDAKRRLARQIQNLRRTEKDREKLKMAITGLRRKSISQIRKLQQENKVVSQELNQTASQLNQATDQLESAEKTIEQESRERERLAAQLKSATARFQDEVKSLQDNFAKSLKAKEAAHESEMEKQKLSAAQRAAAEKKFRAQVAKEREELANRVATLNNKINDSQAQLKEAQEKQKQFQDYIASLEKEKDDLSADLKRSKEIIQAKRKIADQIKRELKKAGVDAEVDGRTGDVMLTFGDEYFDTDKSDLKPSMQKILKKFVPVYAKSLFKDENIAKNIEHVEIVGFSSPTYRGKYVDPKSLKAEDRQAVNYNLDLSYRRARSIFSYMFDTNKMQYQHQKKLLPVVKVTGRSFLAEGVKGRDLDSSLSRSEFCKKHDCKKQQRVVIRFDLKD